MGKCRAREAAAAAADAPAAASSAPVTPADVEIEYCVGCRWLLRAAWMAQELLTTFAVSGEPLVIDAVSLLPNVEKPGGVFRVKVAGVEVWDRKTNGGFPEAKVLKQLVRDQANPEKDLGHSDRK